MTVPDAMMAAFAGRVARGVAVLDVVSPGWHRLIAMDHLVMDSHADCILGQLYGDYTLGTSAVTQALGVRPAIRASEFGFTLLESEQEYDDDPVVDARFHALAKLWRAEIRVRLAQEVGP